MKFLNKLLVLGNIGLALATLLCYTAPYANPSTKLWPLTFFGTGYFYLLSANVLFIGLWFVLKKKYWLLSLAVILIGAFHINSYIGLNSKNNIPSPDSFKVMTYNIGGLQTYGPQSRKRRKAKIDKLIKFLNERTVPEILCLQEYAWVKFFAEELKYDQVIKNKGVAIYTSYQVLDKGKIEFHNSFNAAVWADLKINDEVVRVYNMHLQSNSVSKEAENLITVPGIQTLRGLRLVLAKVKWATSKRASQARLVAKHIKRSPHPVIVCGDFNDTPQSYTFRTISEGLINSFKEKGRGLGITYAGTIPGLHIDHILMDKKFKVEKHLITREPMSDHYPITCRISF